MFYETLRQMADSWGLLYLTIMFVGIVIYTFRPGSREQAEQISNIPFKEDNSDVQD
ncbi:MAG: cbb3-type cytochrome c oxidase subunit 3 [Hyphomicrobiaceae bacterium]